MNKGTFKVMIDSNGWLMLEVLVEWETEISDELYYDEKRRLLRVHLGNTWFAADDFSTKFREKLEEIINGEEIEYPPIMSGWSMPC